MASEWRTTTLGKLCSTITDGAHQSPKTVESGMPMASVKDLNFWGLDLGTARNISIDDYEALVRQGCKPLVGDVLIAKDGNSALDTVCVIEKPIDVVLLSSIAILRPDPEEIDSKYLKYYFMAPSVIDYLKTNFISGAAIPRVVLRDFKRAQISLPNLDEQRSISYVLGSLDDKIELNRQMNETLESIARTIFKSWFVDFDPVRAKANGEPPESICTRLRLTPDILALFPDRLVDSELGKIPEGWVVSLLGDFIEIFDARRIPLSNRERETRQGPYPYHGAAGVMDYVDQYLFDGVFVLMGEDGSVVNLDGSPVLQYVWGRFWVNNHAHVLQARTPITNEQLLLLLRQTNIAPLVTGAVQAKLSQGNLRRIQFVCPPDLLNREFGALVGPIFSVVRSRSEESRALAEVRDVLLPALMTGDVRVQPEGST